MGCLFLFCGAVCGVCFPVHGGPLILWRSRADAGASLLRLHTLFPWAEEVPVRRTAGAPQPVGHISFSKLSFQSSAGHNKKAEE